MKKKQRTISVVFTVCPSLLEICGRWGDLGIIKYPTLLITGYPALTGSCLPQPGAYPRTKLHDCSHWSAAMLIFVHLCVHLLSFVREGWPPVGFDLRCDLYYQILRMSASFFQQHKSGIVARLINDVALAQNLVGNALTNVWMDAVAIVVVLFSSSASMSLNLCRLTTFPLYFIYSKNWKQIRVSSHRVRRNWKTSPAMSGKSRH